MIYILCKKTGTVVEKHSRSDAADFLSEGASKEDVSVCHDYVVVEGGRLNIDVEVSVRPGTVIQNGAIEKDEITAPLIG